MALSIPALNHLRCFEAAARHENFTLAADELCLTPSAVSHQIRTLEAALNVELFVRLGRKMCLSEVGRRYLDDIQPAFTLIAEGTRRLKLSKTREVLTIAVAPSFAEAWLMPNLARFISACPDIEVRLVTGDAGIHETDRNIDCEIRYGHGKWVGVDVEKIADDIIVPLACPEIAAKFGNSDEGNVLGSQLLIHTESRSFNWENWFRARGEMPPENLIRMRVDRSPLAIKAAVDGVGIALESLILASQEIQEGLLVPIPNFCGESRKQNDTYFLVHSPSSGASLRVRAFTDWLRSAFADCALRSADHVNSPSPQNLVQPGQGSLVAPTPR